jgi:hypothetical protein
LLGFSSRIITNLSNFLHPDASRSTFSHNWPLFFPTRTWLIAVFTFFFRLLIVIDGSKSADLNAFSKLSPGLGSAALSSSPDSAGVRTDFVNVVNLQNAAFFSLCFLGR